MISSTNWDKMYSGKWKRANVAVKIEFTSSSGANKKQIKYNILSI